MPTFIDRPTTVKACGNLPKVISEYIGRVNSNTDALSIARMESPPGWSEPGQCPEFDEYSLVLRGALHVRTKDGEETILNAGQALIVKAGEWVQYSTPGDDGADYIAVCHPAFSMDTVHRDAE